MGAIWGSRHSFLPWSTRQPCHVPGQSKVGRWLRSPWSAHSPASRALPGPCQGGPAGGGRACRAACWALALFSHKCAWRGWLEAGAVPGHPKAQKAPRPGRAPSQGRAGWALPHRPTFLLLPAPRGGQGSPEDPPGCGGVGVSRGAGAGLQEFQPPAKATWEACPSPVQSPSPARTKVPGSPDRPRQAGPAPPAPQPLTPACPARRWGLLVPALPTPAARPRSWPLPRPLGPSPALCKPCSDLRGSLSGLSCAPRGAPASGAHVGSSWREGRAPGTSPHRRPESEPPRRCSTSLPGPINKTESQVGTGWVGAPGEGRTQAGLPWGCRFTVCLN